jgi:hypothetical protein
MSVVVPEPLLLHLNTIEVSAEYIILKIMTLIHHYRRKYESFV